MNSNTIKQVPIVDNYITVQIKTLHKTSNMKGNITTLEAQRVKEFQRTMLIQITETEMIMITITQGHGMEH